MALPKAKKQKKPQMSAGQAKKLFISQFGEEPTHKALTDMTQMELVRAYNWYNYCMSRTEAMGFLEAYFEKRDRAVLKGIRRSNEKMFDLSICWTARMVDNGLKVPSETVAKIEPHVKAIITRYAGKADAEKKTDDEARVVDRGRERENALIAEFESMLDSGELNAYQYLTANSTPKGHAQRLMEYYAPVVAEVREAFEKPDRDLKEGYRHLKRNDLRKLLERLEGLVADCDRYANNKVAEKKPRKKRVVSIEKKVANVQYMKSFDPMQLVSQDPSVIPGAKELWVYDARYKDVYQYVALEGGFDVRGTTLQNFDPQLSRKKSLGRKSKEIVDKILREGKMGLRKLAQTTMGDGVEPVGRLNKNMLILKSAT